MSSVDSSENGSSSRVKFRPVFRTLLAGFAVATVALAYTNCGQSFQLAESESQVLEGSSLGSGSSESVVSFRAGETFDGAKVPQASQMLNVFLSELQYQSYQGLKAVAVAPNGLGFVARGTVGTQAEMDLRSIEGCNLLSGGLPCALVARGSLFVVDSNRMLDSAEMRLVSGGSLSIANLHFLSVSEKQIALNTFLAALSPKALAVSADGTWTVHASDAQFPTATADEARRLALEKCERKALVTPCHVMAVDNQRVFNSNTLSWASRVDFTAGSVGASVPGMRDADYNQFIGGQYIPTLRANAALRGALYVNELGGWGAYFAGQDQATVDSMALGSCVQGNPDPARYRCTKYLTGLSVTALREEWLASVRSSAPIHCRAAPRASCLDHRKTGCPPGLSYVVTNGSVTLQACN